MSHAHHKHDIKSVRAGIITISDTRTEADDTSGLYIANSLRQAKHELCFHQIVKDEPEQIISLIRSPPAPIDVAITNGGTGLAPRDTTFEAVSGIDRARNAWLWRDLPLALVPRDRGPGDAQPRNRRFDRKLLCLLPPRRNQGSPIGNERADPAGATASGRALLQGGVMNRRLDAGIRHQAVRGLQTIWLVFIAFIFFYTLILLLLSQQSDIPDSEMLKVLRPAFWVLAALLGIASFIWRQQVADLDHRRRPTSTPGFTRLRVACLITWSLCESIAILGIILGFLSYSIADYAPFLTIGTLLLFFHRPAAWPIDRFLVRDRQR